MKKQRSQDRPVGINEPNTQTTSPLNTFPSLAFSHQIPVRNIESMSQQQFAGAGYPANNFMSLSGNMGAMNPMMMLSAGYVGMESGWNQMPNMDFVSQQNGLYSNSFGTPMTTTGEYGSPNFMSGLGDPPVSMNLMMGQMPSHMSQRPQFQQSSGMNSFSNQQRTSFSEPFAKEEDNAYFRQPVNPHRHQARQRRIRPSDYREL